MSYKRVLLVSPPYSGARVKVVFSAGLGYIAEALEQNGIEYDLINLSAGLGYEDLERKIREFKPDLVGLAAMTYRYKETYQLVARIKEEFPRLTIVMGGAHLSLLREKVLRDCPGLDYGIVLEGEDVIIELCQGRDPAEIKGLIYRDNGQVVYSGDRPFLTDLNHRPFPKYKKFDLEGTFNKEINALPIVSSRGCPFGCTYCPVNFAIGKHFRARSAENIIEELKYWRARGYRRFSFADDNFTLMKDRVVALCEQIKAQRLDDLLLSCDNGIRADRVDRDLLRLMKEAGFYRIAFGVEAGNDKVLKALNKSEGIDVIKQRIREACDLGYEVDLFFLVGAPQETWEDLEESFRLATEFPIGVAYFYNIIPFPNTPLFEWIEQHGRFLIEPEDYLDFYPILDNIPVFETAELPLQQRKKALARAFGVTRRTMRRSWARRLAHLGVLGEALAFLYTARLTQDVILRNSLLRGLVYRLSNLVLKKGGK